MGDFLISSVEIDGTPDMALRVSGGMITEVGALRASAADDQVLDGAGGALIPGLHDHHVHLRSWAAALGSVRVGPPEVTSPAELADALRRAAAKVATSPHRPHQPPAWVRGIAYHESVAGMLDAATLDAFVASTPVRIEHRSGAMWFLNSAALDRLGAHGSSDPAIERDDCGRPTGRIRRGNGWLADATGDAAPDLGRIGRDAAALGVTAFTDADPQRDASAVDHLGAAMRAGSIPQRVQAMGQAGLVLPPHPRLTLGPVKVLLDDDAAADVDAMTELILEARRVERAVAIHCVTRLQLVASLTALDAAGGPSAFGDRIEHGAVIPPELIGTLRRLRLTVVTQPGFVAERGDAYRRDVDPDDQPWLYRCRSLIDAGVPVLLSTDAPYSTPDPWRAIGAAVRRKTPSGAVLGAAERITAPQALARMSTSAALRVGAPADVCLLGEPLSSALQAEAGPTVVATFVGGERIH